MRNCTNPDRAGYDDWICICGDPREVLSGWINGWVSPEERRDANLLAKDLNATAEKLQSSLYSIESSLNHAYGMWRQTL